jgi:hypothetical protein
MMERGQVHERAPKASPDAVSWHISVWAGRLSTVPDATDLSLLSIKAVNAKYNRLCVGQEIEDSRRSRESLRARGVGLYESSGRGRRDPPTQVPTQIVHVQLVRLPQVFFAI